MKNKRLIGACIIVVGVLLLASIPMSHRTSAAPGVPFNLYGKAYTNGGVALPNGQLISSWIDGVRYNFGDNFTWTNGGPGNFDVDTTSNQTRAWDPVIGDWDPDTPHIVEGGYNGSQVMYLWGDGTTTGGWSNYIFQENATWRYMGAVNMDLRAADILSPTTPFPNFEWLVINNVTVDSFALGGIDYVQIYNPSTTNTIDLRDYHFEKNDGQPIDASPTFPITVSSLVMNPNLYNITPQSRVWVNLTALALDLNSTGDELKLVWNNDPLHPNAPFGGLPVVVDRVEYGSISNLTVNLISTGAGNTALFPENALDSDDTYADISAASTMLERMEGNHDGSYLDIIAVNLEVEFTQSALFTDDYIQARWIIGSAMGTWHTLTDSAAEIRDAFDITSENVWEWDVFDNTDLGIQVEYVQVAADDGVVASIDQVNFVITNSAHLGEPDNTIMPDAAAAIDTGPGNEIRRVVLGQDTNDCSVDFETGPESPWIPVMPEQVVVTATHDSLSPDIRLNWTAALDAYGYLVYRDTFVVDNPYDVVIGGGITEYTDIGAYSDGSDHVYLVLSWGNGLINTMEYDNIAYKLNVTFNYYPGVKNGGYNYLSLPYHMNLTTNDAATLWADINAEGTGGPLVTISKWDPSTGTPTVYDGIAGNFLLVRGEAYRIEVLDTMIYTVVGAHRERPIIFVYNGGTEGGVLNYVSVPYHADLADASGLLANLNANGIPPNQITRVAKWDGSTGQWQSKTAIGINFSLTPGEGYLVVTEVSDVMWTSPTITLIT